MFPYVLFRAVPLEATRDYLRMSQLVKSILIILAVCWLSKSHLGGFDM